MFDASEERHSGLPGAASAWLWDQVPAVAAVLRTVCPNPRVGGFVIVTRRDDVDEVLSHPEVFQVRTGVRLQELQAAAGIKNPPPAFELCSDDAQTYAVASKTAADVLQLADAGRVSERVNRFVSGKSDAATLDLGTLLLSASADLAQDYFGLELEKRELLELALCCQAMVSYAFGTGNVNSSAGRVGSMGAAQVSKVLRRSIENQRQAPDGRTIIGRLAKRGMCDIRIESAATLIMMALVAVPTVSSMNAARLLLSRPAAMELARAAALREDDVALGRCLTEALRLRYISPGTLRTCKSEFVIAAGTRRRVHALPGDTVLPVTMSGMLDWRRVAAADAFDPGREASDTAIFGLGRHRCAGFAVGHAMMVAALKPLLRRGLWQTGADRRAVSWFGHYQEHFPVRLG